ncbi:MAG TPA: NAD(P)-binding protein [Phycisphaerae bacterium]|nr:NAD(P)-binding protein [Phycisphaerae bacterium]
MAGLRWTPAGRVRSVCDWCDLPLAPPDSEAAASPGEFWYAAGVEATTPHVIIAGFGPGGRFVAECLNKADIPFVLVEKNPETVRTQAALGIQVVQGDITDADVLRRAGIETASVLALAIPDEQAAIRAAAAAHSIRPEVHIIAATRYTSTGFKALQAGADDVIVAEQAVAREFRERIRAFMARKSLGLNK